MQIRSLETRQPERGVAREWQVGPIVVTWAIERPRPDWMKGAVHLSIKWFEPPEEVDFR